MSEDKQEKFTSIGAISFNRQYFLEVDRCPAVVFVGGTAPRCDAFGSAGPWIYLHRPCTFKEAEKCPVRKYNTISKEMMDELHLWLKETKWIKVEDVKQKLQQLLEEFPVKREYCHEDIGHLSDISPHWRAYDVKEVDEWKKKFEELLKEVKMNET